ncbi:hypothetical protein DRN76_03045 [Methanosarcinales archaeon]|nr:MAG: hypothetical protein DRN76_03045 [Methanosarcinales archaeon]
MVQALPRWLFKKYADIWEKFGDQEISYSDFHVCFEDTSIGTAITKLVRYGWISRIARARYKLNTPEKMTEEVAKL